jgi:membrane protein insertase Oxa1/YidC/SpoIIIJ
MLKNKINTKIKIGLIGILALIVVPVVVSAATQTKYIVSEYNEYYKLASIGGTGLPFDLFEIVRALLRFVYVFAGQISGQNMFIGIIVGTIIIKVLTLKLSPSGAKPKANLSPEEKAEFDRIKEAQKLYFKKNSHDSDLMRMKSSYDQALNKKFNPALAAVGATGQKWYVTLGSFIILFVVYQALQFGSTTVDGQQYSTAVTLMSATPEKFGTFANLSVNEAMSISNSVHLFIGVLYVILSALQQYLMAKKSNPDFTLRKQPGAEIDQQMMTQKIMMFFTPLLFLFFMFNGQWVFGMVLYFITSSIFDISKLVITDFVSRNKNEDIIEKI